jgi:hypothetical protein
MQSHSVANPGRQFEYYFFLTGKKKSGQIHRADMRLGIRRSGLRDQGSKDPGYEIRDPEKMYPGQGVKKAPDPGSATLDRDRVSILRTIIIYLRVWLSSDVVQI